MINKLINPKKINIIITKDEWLMVGKWTIESTCYDLKSSEDLTIKPFEVKLVWTGVKTNFANKIYARSSLPYKKGLMLANAVGVIDSDYTWEIKAQLYNFTHKDVTISKYERIVQMEVWEEWKVVLEVNDDKYDNWSELNDTERWEWWFGSTWQI